MATSEYLWFLMEHCIVYFSRSVGPFDENDLMAILQKSHQNNSQTGVTGVLLYVRGSIIQVLEGEKAAVETLYNRIEQDRRHTNVDQVLNRPITRRLFGNWGMGYETITARQLEKIKSVVDLDNGNGLISEPADNIILRTIKVFYESNRYN